MRDLWNTLEVCTYYNVPYAEVKRWRDDGLVCTFIDNGYWYKYSDLVEYLSD